MNGELIRLVDTIHRDKNIDKESVFESIESSIASAAKKHFGADDTVEIKVNRNTGKVTGGSSGRSSGPSGPPGPSGRPGGAPPGRSGPRGKGGVTFTITFHYKNFTKKTARAGS